MGRSSSLVLGIEKCAFCGGLRPFVLGFEEKQDCLKRISWKGKQTQILNPCCLSSYKSRSYSGVSPYKCVTGETQYCNYYHFWGKETTIGDYTNHLVYSYSALAKIGSVYVLIYYFSRQYVNKQIHKTNNDVCRV